MWCGTIGRAGDGGGWLARRDPRGVLTRPVVPPNERGFGERWREFGALRDKWTVQKVEL